MKICDRCARDGKIVNTGPSLYVSVRSSVDYSQFIVDDYLALCVPCRESFTARTKAMMEEFSGSRLEEGK